MTDAAISCLQVTGVSLRYLFSSKLLTPMDTFAGNILFKTFSSAIFKFSTHLKRIMLPSCVKTEVWRELIESLATKLDAPVVCESAVFGKLSFFQELRNRKSDAPYAPVPGIRYVTIPIDEKSVIVGPFRTQEVHAFDEELTDARSKLPEWKQWYDDLISHSVKQAVLAGRSAHVMNESLSRAKLLLEFSQEMGNVSDVEHAMTGAIQFLLHKFKLSNLLISAYGRQARQFDVSKAGKLVEDRIIAHVRSNKSPCTIQNVSSDFLLDGIDERDTLPKCVLGFPLVADRELVGYTVAFAEHLPPLERIAEVMYELVSLLKRLSQYEKVKHTAVTDPLTGLYNRAQLTAQIDKLLTQLKSKNQPMSVLMTDVDNFKNFNDTKGHPEGDRVLRSVADVMKACAPENALCCRYGGEEFVMVLPNMSQMDAKEVAEKFRKEVQQVGELTISIGLMTCMNSSVSWRRMIEEADRALYRAKHLGKNRVVPFFMVDKSMGVIE